MCSQARLAKPLDNLALWTSGRERWHSTISLARRGIPHLLERARVRCPSQHLTQRRAAQLSDRRVLAAPRLFCCSQRPLRSAALFV